MGRLLTKFIILVVIIPTVLMSFCAVVNGQKVSFGVANYLPISDQNVNDGDIISSSKTGFKKSDFAYDLYMVGVVTINPAVAFNITGADNTGKYPVVSSGNILVNVSAKNGNIKKGDFITSSDAPGIGMKATKSGFVVGTALQDYSSNNKNAFAKINVSLNVHYVAFQRTVRSNILDIMNLSALATYEDPLTVFKYFIAAVVVVFSVIMGLYFFGRMANTGIEALGRNPLAGKFIELGVVVNSLITIAIIAAGVMMAVFIVKL